MPGMSGPQLARRAREKYPGLAVLAMAGSIDESSQEIKPGDDEARLIHKPFTEPDLIAEVHAAIEDAALAT